jgi:hypothetical protein
MAKTSHARMPQPSEFLLGHKNTTPKCPKASAWLAFEVHEAASHVEGRNEVVICHSQSAANA